MKKAVISTGSKQYIVSEGETLSVELLKIPEKSVTFVPLLVFEGESIQVGQPVLDKASVQAEVLEADVPGEKVMAIRYKAKKRVHKVHGHRQHFSTVKIKKIS